MKLNLSTIAILLLIFNPLLAISHSEYQRLCGHPSKLSPHGKNICKKHASQVMHYRSHSKKRPAPISKPVRAKPQKSSPPSQFKEERLKTHPHFKPYTPGAYRRVEKNND